MTLLFVNVLLMVVLIAINCQALEAHVMVEGCENQQFLPCVQNKLIDFFDRLKKIRGFSIIEDFLSIVRIKPAPYKLTSKYRLLSGVDTNMISQLEDSVHEFLETHALRISVPMGIRRDSVSTGGVVNINLGRALGEARKKMKGGMMGTMMMALMGKAAILGPIMMMIVKLKVFKALVLSVLALFLSKLQLLKLLMKSKSGGTGGKGNEHVIIVQSGHDGHGGSSYGPPMGDGGWNSGDTGGGHGGGGSWSSGGSHGGGGSWSSGGGSSGYGGDGSSSYGGSGSNSYGGSMSSSYGGGGSRSFTGGGSTSYGVNGGHVKKVVERVEAKEVVE